MNSLRKVDFLFPTASRYLLLVSGVVFLGGCVVEPARPRRTVYVGPAPVVAGVVVVDVPPPPPREEIVVIQPSPAHLWVRGYWVWQGGRHAWLPGHWELPPRTGSVWVEPRWEQREHGYVFISGRWHNGPVMVRENVAISPVPGVNGSIRYVAQPPPPPRREVVVVRPSAAHIWIKGYWAWRENRHVWLAGHWELPPRPHAVWVEPRWEHHPEGHLFIEGYWR